MEDSVEDPIYNWISPRCHYVLLLPSTTRALARFLTPINRRKWLNHRQLRLNSSLMTTSKSSNSSLGHQLLIVISRTSLQQNENGYQREHIDLNENLGAK
jgi:hypothetical protein